MLLRSCCLVALSLLCRIGCGRGAGDGYGTCDSGNASSRGSEVPFGHPLAASTAARKFTTCSCWGLLWLHDIVKYVQAQGAWPLLLRCCLPLLTLLMRRLPPSTSCVHVGHQCLS